MFKNNQILNFEQANEYLAQFIPKEIEIKFSGAAGLLRAKYLLHLLDNPQNKIKVVHIAGTSGKGSTAYFISLLLNSLNLKVGLHLSPHLVDVRERTQINNQLIDPQKFVDYLNQLIPAIEQITQSEMGKPTYFEITTALAFYIFWKEQVDYAVIETGLGGLYDATNTVENTNKVVVLTKIGLDHTEVLGKTVSKIALQKAEIIHQQNLVVSISQVTPAKKVIDQIASQRSTTVYYVKKQINFFPKTIKAEQSVFNFKFSKMTLKDIQLSMLGTYQIENCALALAAVSLIIQRDKLTYDPVKIKQVLKKAHFSGRMDKFLINGKTLIVDGAHNPQKIQGLLTSLQQIYPDKKFLFLLAFKKGKDYQSMLKSIFPYAKSVVITGFFVDNQDLVHLSEDPADVVKVFSALSKVPHQVITDTSKALNYIIAQKEDVVITGSLYLLSEVYPLISSRIR